MICPLIGPFGLQQCPHCHCKAPHKHSTSWKIHFKLSFYFRNSGAERKRRKIQHPTTFHKNVLFIIRRKISSSQTENNRFHSYYTSIRSNGVQRNTWTVSCFFYFFFLNQLSISKQDYATGLENNRTNFKKPLVYFPAQ